MAVQRTLNLFRLSQGERIEKEQQPGLLKGLREEKGSSEAVKNKHADKYPRIMGKGRLKDGRRKG